MIHSAVHAARHDVGCVIHTHTRAGMAVSAMQCGLLPITQTAARCMPIAYHDYEGPAVDLDERERLVRDLGDAVCMVLRNHGLLTTAPTVAEAFAMAARTELTLPPQPVIDRSVHLCQPQTRRRYGLLEWPAMLRLLDRRDPNWRT